MPTAHLMLRVRPGSDSLQRVVCVCRQRRIEILDLIYDGERIAIAVVGDAARLARVERLLGALVDVLAVEPDTWRAGRKGEPRRPASVRRR